MSLHNTFISLGSTIGLSIGGIVLSQLGYQSLAIAFACFGVAATFVILFFAKDPCNVN
jgi:predicted MFS family arabinose efflux permease